jgi:hypothetical protein
MRWTVWLLVSACASESSGPAHPRARPVVAAAAAPTAATGPGDPECDALITRAVALGIDERAAGSAAPATTASDHEAIRRALRDELGAGCRALDPASYRCAMAAATLDALAACQPIRKSSTSNSKVAPAGITPPAPRSP